MGSRPSISNPRISARLIRIETLFIPLPAKAEVYSRGAATEYSPGLAPGVFFRHDLSPGGAKECSPGREPGVFFRHDLSPGGTKDSFGIFRPSGAAFRNDTYPGLAPGATLCRRSAAEYRRLRTSSPRTGPAQSSEASSSSRR